MNRRYFFPTALGGLQTVSRSIAASDKITIALMGVRGRGRSLTKAFCDQADVNIIHPDLAFAGGFTGTKKIADYAMITRTPVALHNVGSLVLCLASAHFGSAIHNFYRSESALGRPARHVEQMAAGKPPEVKDGQLRVPEVAGLGFEPNNEYLKSQLMPGEDFWA